MPGGLQLVESRRAIFLYKLQTQRLQSHALLYMLALCFDTVGRPALINVIDLFVFTPQVKRAATAGASKSYKFSEGK